VSGSASAIWPVRDAEIYFISNVRGRAIMLICDEAGLVWRSPVITE